MLRWFITIVFVLSFGSVLFAQKEPEDFEALGKGIETLNRGEYEAGRKQIRHLADQGGANAQYWMGVIYSGDYYGVSKNIPKALRWYRISAKQNYAPAQTKIAEIYLNGDGVPKNIVSAHMWYQIADANGDRNTRWTRRRIQREMSREQIAEAKQRAKTCLASYYEDCD